MKKIIAIVAMMLLGIVSLSAQIPQKLSYQAVLRNSAGNVVSDQNLDVNVTILKGSVDGVAVYSETHSTSTSANGVVTLEIGGGVTTDNFSSIDWSNGPFFIRSTTELNGKTISVTSQLLSVPYALYAYKSFLANKVDEDYLNAFVEARVQAALDEMNSSLSKKVDVDSLDALVDAQVQAALEEMNSSLSKKVDDDSLDAFVGARVQAALDEMNSSLSKKVDEDSLDAFLEAHIQTALEERDKRLSALEEYLKSLNELPIIAPEVDDTLNPIDTSVVVPPVDRPDSIQLPFIPLEDTVPHQQDTSDVDPVDTTAVVPVVTPTDTVKRSVAKHGILPGVFNGYHFSQGVLQYHAKKDIWRFAKDQLETLGKSYVDYRKYPTDAWVDRFEYATSGYDGWYPSNPYLGRELYYDDVPISFTSDYDWGYHNAISNGGNQTGVWSLTDMFFWWGVFTERENAENLYSKATVEGVKGFLLLPDDWEATPDFIFTPRAHGFSVNVYDEKQWSDLEALGAVFFPCDSYWIGAYVSDWNAISFTEKMGDFFPEYSDLDYASVSSFLPVRLVISDREAQKIIGDSSIVDLVVEDNYSVVEDENDYLPDGNVDLTNVNMEEGVLPGKFSISESKQIVFSKGNLQYHSESKIWRFAETQNDFIGAGLFDMDVYYRDGWNDLFSWATSGYAFEPTALFPSPYYLGAGLEDIAGTKYDWGVNNAISNGGNTPNIWRTLTKDEWFYLLKREKNGVPLDAPAKVNGTDGFVFLPDDWTFVDDIPYNGNTYVYEDNVYSDELWSRMESLGVVFLPSAGTNRYNLEFDYDMEYWNAGGYWSTTAYEDYRAYLVSFGIYKWDSTRYDIADGLSYASRKPAFSVRLVRDVK